jgi:hypothetical protein
LTDGSLVVVRGIQVGKSIFKLPRFDLDLQVDNHKPAEMSYAVFVARATGMGSVAVGAIVAEIAVQELEEDAMRSRVELDMGGLANVPCLNTDSMLNAAGIYLDRLVAEIGQPEAFAG